ncbi:very short patch repair endonuclease [Zhihengliuella halotolerans]|uniref:very short patch repair endonuclease n=1 Tax=Zhihengliuella halotolerans TaxID=370736 RepID=UPI001CA513C4|nr:very short patch repair endonuclease [Zhihengliuella halotolerans]
MAGYELEDLLVKADFGATRLGVAVLCEANAAATRRSSKPSGQPKTTALLEAAGWSVLRFWEHEDPDDVAARIVAVLGDDAGGR